MRRPPILGVLLVLIGLILAACASPSGSGEPGASAGGEPSAPAESEEPDQSQSGGGGGGGGFGGGEGAVNFEITGGFQDSGELPFVGNFAYFDQAGVTFLVFTDDSDASEANGVIITLSNDGNVLAYITDEIVVPTADCDWNVSRNDATGAAGTFDCNDAGGFGTNGQIYNDLDISGEFEVNR